MGKMCTSLWFCSLL